MGGCCKPAASPSIELPDDLDTGDLLLLQSHSVFGCLTRRFTGSDFDHVGLIVRTATGIKTIECTGGPGIATWRLQDRVDDVLIRKVGIRRCYANIELENINALNQFVQTVKKQPYRPDWCIWLRRVCCWRCCPPEVPPPAPPEPQSMEMRMQDTVSDYCQCAQPEADAKGEPSRDQGSPVVLPNQVPSPRNSKQEAKRQQCEHCKKTIGVHSETPTKESPQCASLAHFQRKYRPLGFCCSSFLAACYMEMGVLSEECSHRKYIPADFAVVLPDIPHSPPPTANATELGDSKLGVLEGSGEREGGLEPVSSSVRDVHSSDESGAEDDMPRSESGGSISGAAKKYAADTELPQLEDMKTPHRARKRRASVDVAQSLFPEYRAHCGEILLRFGPLLSWTKAGKERPVYRTSH